MAAKKVTRLCERTVDQSINQHGRCAEGADEEKTVVGFYVEPLSNETNGCNGDEPAQKRQQMVQRTDHRFAVGNVPQFSVVPSQPFFHRAKVLICVETVWKSRQQAVGSRQQRKNCLLPKLMAPTKLPPAYCLLPTSSYLYLMKLSTIIHHLEQWAPPAYQESYDNSRLLTGNFHMEVTGVLVSLDCVESVVDEAIEQGCNIIVAHHPIIFGGLKSLTGKNYVERTVIKAIKHDIAIYAIHTNLDNMHTGVNRKITDLIGLKDVKVLAPSAHKLMKLEVVSPQEAVENIREALFAIGMGSIGNYENAWFGTEGTSGFTPKADANPTSGKIGEHSMHTEVKLEFTFPSYLQFNVLSALEKAHPYEEFDHKLIALENVNQQIGSGMIGKLNQPEKTEDFLRRIKSIFQCGVIKYTAPIKESISNVAVCGGAGFFLLKNAISQGADIYVTSDVKYHEFFDAENKIVLADIGHYESEQFTKDLIKDKLSAQFPELKIVLGSVNTNPVNYI